MSLHTLRFDYYDAGQLAEALDRIYISYGTDPRTVAQELDYGIAVDIEDAVAEEDRYAFVREVQHEVEVDELVEVEVHDIHEAPGGLMGPEFTYDMTVTYEGEWEEA